MIPHVRDAIQALSQKILTQVLPQVGSNYVMSDTAMIGMLLSALAQEAESGVSRRLTDMMGMAEIFGAAEALGFTVPHAELNLSDMSPAGFEMHEVNRMHDQMTLALIELHGQIEQDANHEDLNEQIWRYLSAMHDRHALAI
jgi:hypothetical protein